MCVLYSITVGDTQLLTPLLTAKLGYNLVEYLIELIQRFINYPPGEPDDTTMRDVALSAMVLFALLQSLQ